MNYNKKTVRDVDVQGKKVLLRCDFNVPLAKDANLTDVSHVVSFRRGRGRAQVRELR